MKSMVKFANAAYEVRVRDGQREVLYNDEWIPSSDFVDKIIENDDWDQIAELLFFGLNVWEEG